MRKKIHKKGIILLITLFFISAISILILQNLNDSESFINEISFDSKLTQLKITNKNIQDEIVNIINKNEKYLDDILANAQSFPLTFGSFDLLINLDYYYEKTCNVNKLNVATDISTYCGNDIFSHIENKYTFLENLNSLRKDGNVTTEEQLLYFLEDYKITANDNQISLIEDQFGYMNLDTNDTTSQYFKCDYEINLDDDTSAKSYFIFKVGNNSILNSYFSL